MLVTVAICTWNRAKLLDQTLAQMCKLRVPKGIEWELLVVNNNCTDNTQQVLERYCDRLPLRPLFEQKQGHSNARNCAIDAATGELMIWTDDDVLVDENWLAEYVRAAEAWPKAEGFAGNIEPWYETTPPKWMLSQIVELKRLFVLRNFGTYSGPMGDKQEPAGANMAIRMDAQRRVRFDTSLGRLQDVLTGADDCDVISRLRAEGAIGVWVGTANVLHFIPTNRLKVSFVRRWYVGAGKTQRLMNEAPDGPFILGAPRWVWKKYAIARAKSLMLSPTRSGLWHHWFREAMMLKGYLEECRRLTAGKASAIKCRGKTA